MIIPRELRASRFSRSRLLSPLLAALWALAIVVIDPALAKARTGPAAADVAASAERPAVATPTSVAEVGPVKSVDRCDGAWSIERLEEEERRALHAACRGEEPPAGILHKALRRLLGADGWHAGALAWSVSPRQPRRWTWSPSLPAKVRSKPPPIDALQREIDKNMAAFAKEERCADLHSSSLIADFIKAAEKDSVPKELPFDSDFLRCLGIERRLSEGTRLLTIRADGLESVVVAFGDSRSTLTRYFGRDDMLELAEHRFVIAAVPEGTPVSLIGNHSGQEVPLQWRAVVGRNQAVWMVPVRQACVSLNVRMAAGQRLFVDGHEVPSLAIEGGEGGERTIDQPMILSRDLPQAVVPDHEIAVLGCAEGEGCEIRYLSKIPAATERPEPRHVCESFRLDLRTRSKKQVAVVRTSRGAACEQSPLWADDLRDRVRYFLSTDERHKTQRELADVYAYAEISGALASLEGDIAKRPGEVKGPDRGVNTSEALGTVAKEAWRQGLDTLMTFEVQCQPKPGRPEEFTYSLQGTMIGVEGIFGRGYYGDEGLDLDQYIKIESIAFDSPSLQDNALAALLDRLFAVPSSRLLHDRVSTHYRLPVRLRVGTVLPGRDKNKNKNKNKDKDKDKDKNESEDKAEVTTPESLRVVYKRIPRHEAYKLRDFGDREKWRPPICSRMTAATRSTAATMKEVKARLDELPGEVGHLNMVLSREGSDYSASRQSGIHSQEFTPPRPGWYLLARQDEDEDEGEGEDRPISDAICVDATYDTREAWGELMIAGGPMVLAHTDVSTFLTRARVGYVYYPFPSLGAGVRGGYQNARYTLGEGVAKWQDLDVLSPAITWQRHALTVGPLIEARTRFTRVPFELRARVSPHLDFGLVSIPHEQVPVALSEFRTTSVSDTFFDLDVGVDLDFIIGYALGPVQIQHGLMLGLMALDDRIQETGGTAAENFAGVIGFSLGVGGGRRKE